MPESVLIDDAASGMSTLRHRVLQLVTARAPLAKSLEELCRGVQALTGGGCAVSRRVDGFHVLAAGPDIPSDLIDRYHALPLGVGPCTRACQLGEARFTADTSTHEDWEGLRDIAQDFGVTRYATHPVVNVSGEAIAAVSVANPTLDRDATLEVLRVAAELVTIAMECTRAQVTERNFDGILDTSMIEVLVIDLRTMRFLDASAAALENLGYTIDDLRKLTLFELTPADSHGRIREFLASMMQGGTSRCDAHHIRRDGSTYPVAVSAHQTTHNGLPAIMGLCIDVTREREAIDFGTSRDNLFRTIFESEPECVKLVDRDYRLIDMNPAGLTMVEADSIGDVRGANLLDVVVPEAHALFSAAVDEVFRDGASNSIEFEIIGLRGTRRYMEQHQTPLRKADGTIWASLAVTRDVTERVENDRERERLHAREKLLFRELDHRVRNSLASLVSLVAMDQRAHDDVDSFARSISGRISAMAGVHSLLSRSHWAAVPLSDVVSSIADASELARIDLEGDRVEVPAAQVTALGMVVHELLTNSRKYGALSVDGGRIRMAWMSGGQVIPWTWEETDGPPVKVPLKSGTGFQLIEGLMASDLHGSCRFDYHELGVRHAFEMSLAT